MGYSPPHSPLSDAGPPYEDAATSDIVDNVTELSERLGRRVPTWASRAKERLEKSNSVSSVVARIEATTMEMLAALEKLTRRVDKVAATVDELLEDKRCSRALGSDTPSSCDSVSDADAGPAIDMRRSLTPQRDWKDDDEVTARELQDDGKQRTVEYLSSDDDVSGYSCSSEASGVSDDSGDPTYSPSFERT